MVYLLLNVRMVSKLETLQADLEELRRAEEELSGAQKELREIRRYKEAEVKRLVLQKHLLLARASDG